ncbi:MAG: cupin domain-containing protein [Reyranella sp.]|nr:MAG: cupin domain-containing protein [Reyranella sp.]
MIYYHKLADIPRHQRPSSNSQIVAGKSLMAVWVNVKAGTHIAAHRHPNEQITWLITGRMEYRIADGELTMCEPGTIVHIPADIEHEVWYREDCRYCELFSPPRFDLYPSAIHNPYGVE